MTEYITCKSMHTILFLEEHDDWSNGVVYSFAEAKLHRLFAVALPRIREQGGCGHERDLFQDEWLAWIEIVHDFCDSPYLIAWMLNNF